MCMRYHLQNNMKMGPQRQTEMPLILGRSETQYVAVVTKLFSSKCGAHYFSRVLCKESNNSTDTKNLVECMMSSLC